MVTGTPLSIFLKEEPWGTAGVTPIPVIGASSRVGTAPVNPACTVIVIISWFIPLIRESPGVPFSLPHEAASGRAPEGRPALGARSPAPSRKTQVNSRAGPHDLPLSKGLLKGPPSLFCPDTSRKRSKPRTFFILSKTATGNTSSSRPTFPARR